MWFGTRLGHNQTSRQELVALLHCGALATTRESSSCSLPQEPSKVGNQWREYLVQVVGFMTV
jgi:hypothetical protein